MESWQGHQGCEQNNLITHFSSFIIFQPKEKSSFFMQRVNLLCWSRCLTDIKVGKPLDGPLVLQRGVRHQWMMALLSEVFISVLITLWIPDGKMVAAEKVLFDNMFGMTTYLRLSFWESPAGPEHWTRSRQPTERDHEPLPGFISPRSRCCDYRPFRHNEAPQILARCVLTRAKAGWDVLWQFGKQTWLQSIKRLADLL